MAEPALRVLAVMSTPAVIIALIFLMSGARQVVSNQEREPSEEATCPQTAVRLNAVERELQQRACEAHQIQTR